MGTAQARQGLCGAECTSEQELPSTWPPICCHGSRKAQAAWHAAGKLAPDKAADKTAGRKLTSLADQQNGLCFPFPKEAERTHRFSYMQLDAHELSRPSTLMSCQGCQCS